MPDNSLIEISLTVEDELVEPVAEVLARFVKGGVAIESTAVTNTLDGSAGQPIGPLRVFGYLSMDKGLEEKRRRLEEALWYLGRIRPLPEPQFRTIAENDWAEAWKQHYHPIPIGKRLMIIPAWLEVPPLGREPIWIDPGMAFGTGTHPTTQLCLEMIEAILETRPAGSSALDVIDIGCGTAILSIAALRLGASRALGVDIDPDAVRAAAENASRNGLSDRLDLALGSLAEVLSGSFSLASAGLILANILAPVCIRLLDEGLARLLTKDGSLVLSGILDVQAGDVEAAALRNGLRHLKTIQSGDWVALEFAIFD